MIALLKLTAMTALLLLAGLSVSAQKPADLVGTWIGPATLDGQTETNELTLVLELKDGKLAGNMTGSYGTINEAPMAEVTLEKDSFVFSVEAEGPQGAVMIKFTMKITGDSMTGQLEIPDMGMGGTWEASKQK